MGTKIITTTTRTIKSQSNQETTKIITISHQPITVSCSISPVHSIPNSVKMVSTVTLPDHLLEKHCLWTNFNLAVNQEREDSGMYLWHANSKQDSPLPSKSSTRNSSNNRKCRNNSSSKLRYKCTLTIPTSSKCTDFSVTKIKSTFYQNQQPMDACLNKSERKVTYPKTYHHFTSGKSPPESDTSTATVLSIEISSLKIY